MALPSPTVAALVAGRIPQGTQAYVFFPTCANINSPTSAELTAGTNYANQIASVDGFEPSGAVIDQPNAGSTTVPNVPGLVTLGDGTVTFNLSKTGTGDVRTVFNDNVNGNTPTAGYWAFIYEGIVTGAKMRVFQVTVTKVAPSMQLDAPLTMAVQFALQAASPIIAVPTV